MKKTTLIICGIFVFCFILLAGCLTDDDIFCDDFPENENCICPNGQKRIATQIGFSCFDESVCEYLTLSDNESACVKECPSGYLPFVLTGGDIGSTCVNVKKINKSNYWLYGRYILKTSNLSWYNEKECTVIDEIELEENKFELVFTCYNHPENCSLYLYNDTTFEYSGCVGNE